MWGGEARVWDQHYNVGLWPIRVRVAAGTCVPPRLKRLRKNRKALLGSLKAAGCLSLWKRPTLENGVGHPNLVICCAWLIGRVRGLVGCHVNLWAPPYRIAILSPYARSAHG